MTGMTLDELRTIAAGGESASVEYKTSTAQLPRTGETLCGMLNGSGGMVLVGVRPDGSIAGQDVSDATQQEIARVLDRIQPSAPAEFQLVSVSGTSRSVIVFTVPRSADGIPFTYDGRPYQRIGTTTSRMPRERYEQLLLQRDHARRRWENQVAVGVRLDDLDHEEILRTRDDAIRFRRISAGTSLDVGDILDRLGLRRDGELTQAAQVLYGTRFLPDYPQAKLKLGRFRGTKITGDILDNKQEYYHAFAAVREAMAFLDRTLPLSGHFVKGRIQREDRLPVPADALREIILNAVMHRDYSYPGSDVAVAVFDDRIEISSYGSLPTGLTAEMLSGSHPSVLRNPLIAQTFHRTGAIEAWGRGTNRVIDECKNYGIDPPTFELRGNSVVVTFRAKISVTPQVTPQVTTQVTTQVTPQVTTQVLGVLAAAQTAKTRAELQEAAGLANRKHFRKAYLEPLLKAGWIEMTIPDKPRSSSQQYRTTEQGKSVLQQENDA